MASTKLVARLPANLGSHLSNLNFACLGAAHVDTIHRLDNPALRNRTNPVGPPSRRCGGVAANIACALAMLGVGSVSLHCPPPPAMVREMLKNLGIQRHNVGSQGHDCGYTAILNPDGELELGIADMNYYDGIGPGKLPTNFPGRRKAGVAIMDAAFAPATMRKATRQARQAGWQVVAAATSAAKVSRLSGIELDLLVLNEAEAKALSKRSSALCMAQEICALCTGWVAITQGARGAVLVGPSGKHYQATPKKSGNVTDTIGAGDVFIATLAAGMHAAHNGVMEIDDALRFAVQAGAKAAQRGGRA